MAVVIRAPAKRLAGEIVIPKKPSPQYPTWTGTARTNARIQSRLSPLTPRTAISLQYVLDMPSGIENRKPNVVGIKITEPLGIITFEDIIDRILQKTSRDEMGFYDRSSAGTANWCKKSVGYGAISIVHPDGTVFTGSEHQVPNNTLHRRTPSNKGDAGATMDGANERSLPTERMSSQSLNQTPQIKTKSRKDYVDSSYTQNSRGGFHGHVDFSASVQNSILSFNEATPEVLAALGIAPPPTPANEPNESTKSESVSLPTRKATSPFRPGDWNPYTRRYVSAMPVLPGLPRVTPFSRQEYSSFDREAVPTNEIPGASLNGIDSALMVANDTQDALNRSNDQSELIMPHPAMTVNPLSMYGFSNVSGLDVNDSLEFSRIGGEGLEAVDVQTAPPYAGFPLELLDQVKENQVPNFASRTMPRLVGGLDGSNDLRGSLSGSETNVREGSFHDDRALLPSQRRALNGSAENVGGIRSTSFWF